MSFEDVHIKECIYKLIHGGGDDPRAQKIIWPRSELFIKDVARVIMRDWNNKIAIMNEKSNFLAVLGRIEL